MKRLLLALAIVGGCHRGADLPAPSPITDPEARFREAKRLFDMGKYREAAKMFAEAAYPKNPKTPEAKYYAGLASELAGELDVAEASYFELRLNYPRSPWAALALLGLARVKLKGAPPLPRDQEDVEVAKGYLLRFLGEYPDHDSLPEAKALLQRVNERLAAKEWRAIDVYHNLKKYEAELLCLDLLIKEYPETSYRWRALLRKAQVLSLLGREEEAQATLEEIIESEASPAWAKAQAESLKLGLSGS